MRRMMATMFALGLAFSQAKAEQAGPTDDLFPALLMNTEEAQAKGWSRAELRVGAAGLDHSTLLPPEAELETAPFEEAEWSGPGRLQNVAKIMIPSAFGEIDGTVMAFQIRSTGSAVRLCAYLVAARGYEVDTAGMSDDRTRAQFLSLAYDDEDRVEGGMYTDCRTRGRSFLVHHFAFPATDVTDYANLENRVRDVLGLVLPITSNLEFADGQPDGYGDAAELIELRLGSGNAIVPVPIPMQVEWNDFEKVGATRELYLLQDTEGPGVAVVWLGARDEPTEPDLAEAAPRLAAHQFMLQSQGVPEPTLVLNQPLEPSVNDGVPGQAFRFDATAPNGVPGGSIEGEAYWKDGRLYVVTWFTNIRQEGTVSSLIARLPSQTSFDLVRHSLLSALRTE